MARSRRGLRLLARGVIAACVVVAGSVAGLAGNASASPDPMAPGVIAAVPSGPAVLSPNGALLFVAGPDKLYVVKTADETVAATVSLQAAPIAVAVTPNGQSVIVAERSPAQLEIFAITTSAATPPVTTATAAVGPVPLTAAPEGVVVSTDGTRAFAQLASDEVGVVSLTPAVPSQTATWSVPGNLTAMGLSRDGQRLYAAIAATNPGANPADPGRIVVLSTSTGATADTIYLGGNQPRAAAVSPDGTRLIVGGDVAIVAIDTNSDAIVATSNYPAAAGCDSVAVGTDSKTAYCTVPGRDLSWFSTASLAYGGVLDLGGITGATNASAGNLVPDVVLSATRVYVGLDAATGKIASIPQHAIADATIPDGSTPQPPTAVKVVATGNNQAYVTWGAPANDGGLPITGYTATAASQAGSEMTCVTGGSGTGCTIYGLTAGVTYSVTVVATNAAGNGPGAPTIPPTVTPGAPGPPSNVSAVASLSGNTGSIAVSWALSASNGATPITQYKATASPTGTTGSVVSCTGGATVTACVITPATRAASYLISVVAISATGSSTAATAPSVVIVGAPAAPTGITVQITAAAGQPASASVSWSAPQSDGGSPITGYSVTSSPGNATCSTTNAATTSCVLNGLTNGTVYTISVLATNVVGRGVPAVLGPLTAGVVPSPVSGITTTAGSGSVTVAWNVPSSDGGSPITGYTATASPGAAACSTTSRTATTCRITGLTNGTVYTISVVATNSIGRSSAASSNAVTPGAVPDRVSSVTVTAGVSLANVTWTVPAANGSPITGYRAIASPGGATCSTSGSGTGCTITGLTNGTPYTVSVVAINAFGQGPAGVSGRVLPQGPPSQPIGLDIALGGTNVAVSWSAPSNNGGMAITGYVVTATRADGAGDDRTCKTGASAFGCELTGLVRGITYQIAVTATNAFGVSSPSTASLQVPGKPGRVGKPTASVKKTSKKKTSTVTVKWSAAAANGSTITKYQVTRAKGGTLSVSGKGRSVAFKGLKKGTYKFTVVAINGIGRSTASLPVTVRVK